jgi:phosphoribosylaminoimidazolecarboxamide formyltransferase/IMP cyclohydrolase/phosphoribosylaminoimidazolecarboxamide formyltransferase
LVRELKNALNLPAAASFKHVSPAGAAVGVPYGDTLGVAYNTPPKKLSPLAFAYARARGADRMSSYGDFAALSDIVDVPTARLLSREVSDGVIAPGYEPEALEILQKKRGGSYCVVQIDANYAPEAIETRTLYGITMEQERNAQPIDENLFTNIVTQNKDLPDAAKRDLILSLITLKYTQSNSVCYALDGQAIGIGAGQQSRVHCTRLAGNKADIWFLRQHPALLELAFLPEVKRPDRDNLIDQLLLDDAPEVFADASSWSHLLAEKPHVLSSAEKKEWLAKMSGVSLGSDAFFPFGDNIERAAKSGVRYIAQAGGSIRDDNVIETCDKYGMVMALTGLRLFHH